MVDNRGLWLPRLVCLVVILAAIGLMLAPELCSGMCTPRITAQDNCPAGRWETVILYGDMLSIDGRRYPQSARELTDAQMAAVLALPVVGRIDAVYPPNEESYWTDDEGRLEMQYEAVLWDTGGQLAIYVGTAQDHPGLLYLVTAEAARGWHCCRAVIVDAQEFDRAVRSD